MRNLFIAAMLCMLFTNRSGAQITLEHTFYPAAGSANVILFSSNGEKIMINDTGVNQVKLYNTDYSLWKTINLSNYPGYKFQAAYAVSDNLFNSDNLVELVAVYYNSATGIYKAEVINESSTVLQDLGNTWYAQVHIIGGVYKLETLSLGTAYSYSFYALPGILPCGECNSLGTQRLSGSNPTIFISDPSPNPSSGVVRINYTMPAGYNTGMIQFFNSAGQAVKQTPVFARQNFVEINNSILPAGTYQYNLKADNLVSDTKTMVIK